MAVIPSFIFQFHYGTIIRIGRDDDTCISIEFQFHYGTIIRTATNTYHRHPSQISIPLWYDYKSEWEAYDIINLNDIEYQIAPMPEKLMEIIEHKGLVNWMKTMRP